MLCALDGQHAGKSQLVHLLGKERNGFKAGLGFGRAARKGGKVAQAVIIHQIAERETVAEQNGLMGRTVHSRLIVCVKGGQLVPIRRGVGDIGVLVVRVDGTQRVRKRHAECLGVLQGQPDMLVLFLPMVMPHQLVKDILCGKRVLHKKRIGLATHQRIEAVVAEVDMEMLRLARLVAVVVELHILGRIGTGGFELIADAADLALVIQLRLITGIGVFSGNGFSVCISEGDRVPVDRDLLGVALPRSLKLLQIGVLCGRAVLVLLRPVLAEFVQVAVQQIGVQGLPRTGEIREGAILDVILCELFIVAVTVVVTVLLHTLNGLLRFHGVAQDLQQIDDLHIPIGGVFQSIFHPAVGLAAHIDEEVAVGDLDDVIRCGLVAVQVNTVVQQHGQIGAPGLVAENFLDPVIFWENGSDNAQFIGFSGILRLSAAGKDAGQHH